MHVDNLLGSKDKTLFFRVISNQNILSMGTREIAKVWGKGQLLNYGDKRNLLKCGDKEKVLKSPVVQSNRNHSTNA